MDQVDRSSSFPWDDPDEVTRQLHQHVFDALAPTAVFLGGGDEVIGHSPVPEQFSEFVWQMTLAILANIGVRGAAALLNYVRRQEALATSETLSAASSVESASTDAAALNKTLDAAKGLVEALALLLQERGWPVANSFEQAAAICGNRSPVTADVFSHGSPLALNESVLLRRLYHILITRFDLSEIRSLAFELQVPYEDLGGEARTEKARELLVFLQRRRRLHHLIALGAVIRPDISWPDAPRDPQSGTAVTANES